MTSLTSEKALINRNAEKIFAFLGDFNNFEKLMPEQVINWKSTADQCSFTIQGMTDLEMRISERIPFSKIIIQSHGEVPFDFELICFMHKVEELSTETYLVFNAKLNPMLQMLAKTPLQNFVNILVNKLKEISEQQEFSSQ